MATKLRTWGEVHKDFRERKGWSQQRAAFELGVSYSAIQSWERTRNPKEPTLRIIRRAVEVYGDDILAFLYAPGIQAKGRYLKRPFLAPPAHPHRSLLVRSR